MDKKKQQWKRFSPWHRLLSVNRNSSSQEKANMSFKFPYKTKELNKNKEIYHITWNTKLHILLNSIKS